MRHRAGKVAGGRAGRLASLLVATGLALALLPAGAAPAATDGLLIGSGLDFGVVGVGGHSAPQTLTLSNGGNETLVIEEIELAGPAGTDFEVTYHGCSGARLAPGQSCPIELRASPSGKGVRTGALVVEHSSSSSPDSFALTVTGRSRTGGFGRGHRNPPSGDGSPPSRAGHAPRIHTRTGLLTLGWAHRVAVATVSCPVVTRGSCRLTGAAVLSSRGRRLWVPVRAPARIPAGSWARVFVVVPGPTARRFLTSRTSRRPATLAVDLQGYGPSGVRSHAFMRRLLIP